MPRSVLLVAALLAAAPPAPPPAPAPAFVDRAAEWGLAFRYDNGATGQLYYPEIVGGGVALFDYDNDGDLDVFFVQGAVLEPGKAGSHPITPPGGRLFRNDLIKDGVRQTAPRFVDVTAESGIKALGYGMGVAVGDFDNDGWPDLYVLNFGANQLWRNNGDGTFTDVTQKAGADDPRLSLSASFADLDRDGWLDLYVADYVDFAVDHNVVCYAASSRRDYCGPSSFPPAPDRLLHNRGGANGGTFEDVSQRAGIAGKAGRGMGVVVADFDGDGRPDVFVANDGMENFLWRNRGDLTFEEVALPAGVAVNADGKVQANMGIAAGDFDDDGDLDLYVTHLAGEGHTLWVNLGHGRFEDRTLAAGLAAPSLPFTGFGTGWIDYDNDGRLDLLAIDGAVRGIDAQAERGEPFPYAQTHQMFRNLGQGRFADVSREMGEPFRRAEVGRGAAFGDIDNDGDTDVVIVTANGPARLLVNQVGSRRPWLGLRLVGRPAGARGERDMLGALAAVVRKGAPTLWRRAATDGSYASASDPRVLVGLGDAPEVTEVRVLWPDGRAETFPPPPLRVYTKLVEGTGRPSGETPGSPRGDTAVSRGPALLLAALLAAPTSGPVGDPPVRFPDLVPLESGVAAQLAAAQQRLGELAAAGGVAPAALAAAYGDLGKLYHAYELREPAEACYRNAARLAPRDPAWPHALGVLLQDAGRPDEAAAAYRRAVALSPGDVAALVHLGEIARLEGRTAEAEEVLGRALDAAPASPAAAALLGQTALDRRDWAAAVRRLESALAAVPGANRLHYLLAQAYRGMGDTAKAGEHLAQAGQVGVRAADPLLAELEALRTGERVSLARAKTAFQNGRYAEAAELYRRALDARPESVEARVNLAAALVQLGDRAGAAAALREALRRDPGNATAHFDLGTLLALAGPSAEAREHLAAAAAALPRDAEAHRALAAALRDGGSLEAALAEYARAVALDAANEGARLGEAETLVRMARYREARGKLEEAMHALPASGLLAHGLARLLAACPDPSLRDGARARDLAFAVWQARPTAAHAETVALAAAELGDCGEAARWQQIAIEAARGTGLPAAYLEQLNGALARYARGAPCR